MEDDEFPGHGHQQRGGDQPGHRAGLGQPQRRVPAQRHPPAPGAHHATGDQQEDEVVEVGEEGEAHEGPEGQCPPAGGSVVEAQQRQQAEGQQLQVRQVVVSGVEEAVGGEGEGRPGHERRRPAAGDVMGQQVGPEPRQHHGGQLGEVGGHAEAEQLLERP